MMERIEVEYSDALGYGAAAIASHQST